MKKEEIKLITEFMGKTVAPQVGTPEFRKWKGEKCDYSFYELKYDTSWDWLMTCIEKIESLRFQFADYNSPHSCNVRISQGYIEIEGTTGQRTHRNVSVEGSKIKAVFLIVIDFINWYNSIKEKNIFKNQPL